MPAGVPTTLPRRRRGARRMSEPPILIEARDATRAYPGARAAWWRRAEPFRAVDHVSVAIRPGETVALVGESGSGKSTLGRMMLGLTLPSAGVVLYEGRDLATFRGEAWTRFRREVQVVFQDSGASLNPRRSIGHSVEIPLRYSVKLGRARHTRCRRCVARSHRPAAGAFARPAAARIVGRPAPACVDRARHRHESARDRGRRAGVGARCVGAGANPAADARFAAARRPRLSVHHPRSRCRAGDRRSRRGSVPRRHHGIRPCRDADARAAAPLHAHADRRDPGAGPHAGVRPSAAEAGRRAGDGQRRVPLPRPLPARRKNFAPKSSRRSPSWRPACWRPVTFRATARRRGSPRRGGADQIISPRAATNLCGGQAGATYSDRRPAAEAPRRRPRSIRRRSGATGRDDAAGPPVFRLAS